MSKVTDRIDNQNIINLARQQFETQKRSKLPSVIVPLASAGKIYPIHHALRCGTVEMRYMTAYDEDILTNSTYIKNGVVFDRLLESIIMSDVAVSDIAEADRFGLIINARILAYGPEYAVTVSDPKTKNMLNRVIDLRKLTFRPFTLQPDDSGEFEYEINSDTTIRFKYPNKDIESETVSEYLKNIITQVKDSRDPETINEFIRYEFFAADAKRFRKFVTENMPGLNLTVEFEGEDGSTFSAGFPIGPELFWF